MLQKENTWCRAFKSSKQDGQWLFYATKFIVTFHEVVQNNNNCGTQIIKKSIFS